MSFIRSISCVDVLFLDSCCGSEVGRMMTPDSLMMTSQTSTTLSCGPTTTLNDNDDDVIIWPEPPSPIDHLTTEGSHVTIANTATPSGVDDRLPPVMTLTFTVKLDSDLIKNKSIIQQAPTSVLGEVILQGGRQSTSGPSRPAVIIPDVVVCAGATTMASVDRGSDSQVSRQVATATSLVAVVDAKCCYDDEHRSRAVKESRSCQTEPSTTCNTQCVTCSRPTNENAATTMQQSMNEVPEDDCDDVFDDVASPGTNCRCRCRVDDGSYLRPLVTTRVYNSRSSPLATSSRDQITSGATSVRHDSEELTHMSWNEVLEEAQTMGIELHPPHAANTRQSKHHAVLDSNRSPSIMSFQSSIMDVDSPSCRSPRRHLLPVADDIDELSQMIDQSSVSNVVMMNESTNKKKSSTSFRDLFSKLFSSKKKSSSSSATVKRSKSLEQPHRIQTRNLPVKPSNSSKYLRQDSSNSESNRSRLSRACSRYSASSCPSTSGHVVGRIAPPSRTISVASSTMRCVSGQTTADYFLGSTCSSGVGMHGGSLPAIHRHRVTSSSTSRGDQSQMTTSFDAGDMVDGCSASPSVSSFSNTCSRSTQWRSAVSGTTSPTKQISKSCHMASGMMQ